MDIIFALIGFYLLVEFFYLVQNIRKLNRISKKIKLITGILGLIGVLIFFLILKSDQLPSRMNHVILPTFDWAVADWGIVFTFIIGTIENLILVLIGIFGKTTNITKDDSKILLSKTGETILEDQITDDDSADKNVMLEIYWKGAYILMDNIISIMIDNIFVGSGSFVKGFTVTAMITEGKHKIELKYLKTTSIIINAEKNKKYRMDLQYSRAWGNFKMSAPETVDK